MIDVRSGGAVVAPGVTYPVYDSVAETLKKLGEEATLKLINQQSKTNAANDARKKATSKPTKEALRGEAFCLIDPQAFATAQGEGPAAVQKLLDDKVAELEVQHEEERKARLVQAAGQAKATPAPETADEALEGVDEE